MFFFIKKLSVLFLLTILFVPEGHGKPVTVKKPSVARPKLFVLAVGVNQYKDDFFPALKWAEKDAGRFAAEIGKDGEFAVERIVLTGAKVSMSAVEDALKLIARQSKRADMLVVYLSGHGSLRLGKDGDLEPVLVLPETSSTNLSASSLPQRSILAWMDALKVRKKVLITAACHSGVGKSRLTPEIKKILAQSKGAALPELSEVSEGVMVLSAAAKNEVAVEDDRYQSDLYSHFFLTALDVFDRNQDGSVSVLEAHDYASDMTFKMTKGRQRPTIQTEAIGDIDFPLRGKPNKKALPLLQEYDQQFAGIEIDVNRQQKGRLPFAFPLLPGRNVVAVYSQDRAELIGEYVLRVQPGQIVSVDDILAGQPFSAGPYFAVMQPQNRVYKKLSDESTALTTGIFGSWKRDSIVYSFRLQMPARTKSEVLSGIDVSLREYLLTLSGGYDLLQMQNMSASIYLLAGPSEIEMKVSDQNTGFTKTRKSAALTYGLGLGLGWMPGDLMVFSLDMSMHKLKHDFGEFGSLAADRRFYTLGVGFSFGGLARRK